MTEGERKEMGLWTTVFAIFALLIFVLDVLATVILFARSIWVPVDRRWFTTLGLVFLPYLAFGVYLSLTEASRKAEERRREESRG